MKKAHFANIDDDDFERQCGEVFLTFKGNISFHCTLCDTKYSKFKGFNDYAVHIQKMHIKVDMISPPFPAEIEQVNIDPLATVTHIEEKEFKNVTLESNRSTEELIHGYTKSKKREETNLKLLDAKEIGEKAIKKQTNHKQETTKLISDSESTMDFGKILESVDLQIKKKRYKREDRKYKCPHCDFAAKDSTNLAYHVRRHSDNKPHKCTDCDRAFYTKSELNTHGRTHTGEKPFLCTDCGRAFMTSGMLSDHTKRHKNLREKECAVCGMKFFSAKQLRAHIVVHCEDRLHNCSECEKKFKQRVALKNHMKLHANKREYQCEFCNSSFNQSSGLYSHMKNKHSSVSPVSESQNQNREIMRDPCWLKTSSDLEGSANDIKNHEIKI